MKYQGKTSVNTVNTSFDSMRPRDNTQCFMSECDREEYAHFEPFQPQCVRPISSLSYADLTVISDSGSQSSSEPEGSNKQYLVDEYTDPHLDDTGSTSTSINSSAATIARHRTKSVLCPTIDEVKVDRLACTCHVPFQHRKDMVLAADDLEHSRAKGMPRLHFLTSQKKARYKYQYLVLDDQGNRIARIEYDPYQTGNAFFRLDCNPAKLSSSQLQLLHRGIKALFGYQWEPILRKAKITLIDLAIDIHGIPFKDLVTYGVRAGTSGTWGKWFKKGKATQYCLETIYIGSKQFSPRALTVYDKRQERLAKGKAQDATDCIRVEGRLRPRVVTKATETTKRKTTSGIPLWKLSTADNPFDALEMAAYSLPQKGDWQFDLFMAASQIDGVDATVHKITDAYQRTRIRKYLAKGKIGWWNPSLVMEQAAITLRDTGLFPPAAFDPPVGDE